MMQKYYIDKHIIYKHIKPHDAETKPGRGYNSEAGHGRDIFILEARPGRDSMQGKSKN
jgi:hypothetical protein